jgi:hypothetical protein
MAAREVAVSAIATVYSIDSPDEEAAPRLEDRFEARWPLPTALAFLAWFVFAPHASRQSRSRAERRTAGSGRCSWSDICSCSPIWRRP